MGAGAGRIKDQADFDLERIIDLFDDALTSKDERIVNALRSLLMIVALTAPESTDAEGNAIDRKTGPLRRMKQDIDVIARRLSDLENRNSYPGQRFGQQDPYQPYGPSQTWPGTNGPYPTTAPGTRYGQWTVGDDVSQKGPTSFTATEEYAKDLKNRQAFLEQVLQKLNKGQNE